MNYSEQFWFYAQSVIFLGLRSPRWSSHKTWYVHWEHRTTRIASSGIWNARDYDSVSPFYCFLFRALFDHCFGCCMIGL
jgi:hypothetical protein